MPLNTHLKIWYNKNSKTMKILQLIRYRFRNRKALTCLQLLEKSKRYLVATTNPHIANHIEELCKHLLYRNHYRRSAFKNILKGIEFGATITYRKLEPVQYLSTTEQHAFNMEFYELCKKYNCVIQYTSQSGSRFVKLFYDDGN